MSKSWLDLTGKTYIVTGGASGIGFAITKELLENGANVAICDVCNVDEMPQYEDRIVSIKTDVSDGVGVQRMVAQVQTLYGKIDGIVNNAGVNIPRLLVDEDKCYELDEVIWDKMMNINLKGVFLCTQAVVREMLAQGHGVIINISSECGPEGSIGQSAYAATKNAVDSLTRSWAKELGDKGIRVVGIAPGILEATGLRTPAYEMALSHTRGITVEKLRASYLSPTITPLGRSGRLAEVANVVAFLCSERAGYIHGVTINIAGGKTRG